MVRRDLPESPKPNGLTPRGSAASGEAAAASSTTVGSNFGNELRLISPGGTQDDGTVSGIVVHLLAARDVPRLLHLNRTKLSPYVTMHIINHAGVPVGRTAEWLPRHATRQPVWNSARDMAVPQMSFAELKRSLLHVELWDYSGGFLPPNPIGSLDVPLTTLLAAEHIPLPIA